MNCKKFIFQLSLLVLFICTLLESTSVGDKKDCQKRVIRYLSMFDDSITGEHAKKLTHIIYQHAIMHKNQSIIIDGFKNKKIAERAKTTLDKIFLLKKINPNLKIMFSGFFSGTDQELINITSTEKVRATFVSEIIKIIDRYGFDGYEFGWELSYSDDLEKKFKVSPFYFLFVKEMRIAFDEYTKKNKRNSKLVISVFYGPLSDEKKDILSKKNQYIDFVTVAAITRNQTETEKYDPFLSKITGNPNPSLTIGYVVKTSTIDKIMNDHFCAVKDTKKLNLLLPSGIEFMVINDKQRNEILYHNTLEFLADIRQTRIKALTKTLSSDLKTGGENDSHEKSSQKTTYFQVINHQSIKEGLKYISEKNIGGIVMFGKEFDNERATFDDITPSNLCSRKKIQDTYKCSK